MYLPASSGEGGWGPGAVRALRALSACAACPMLRCRCNVSAALRRGTHDFAANIGGLLPCPYGLLWSVPCATLTVSRTALPWAGQVTLRGKMTTSPSLVRSRRASPSASRQVKGGNVTSASPGYCAGAGAGRRASAAVGREGGPRMFEVKHIIAVNFFMSLWIVKK